MVPYEDLTHLGRVRRMRQLARASLDDYGLADARFAFLRQAGNTLFRVSAVDRTPATAGNGPFKEGQYLLRIHQPDYQTADAIELELAWLAAMRRDADLPVPEPVPTLDGRLLTQVSIPGIPGKRNCSLLRWLKGRFLAKGIGTRHHRALGRLFARMHNHAAQWQPPPGLTKRRWDRDGLFVDVEGMHLTGHEIWPLIPRQYVEPFQTVAQEVGRVMEEWGTGPDVYGLIHSDLGLDANVLFWRGEAQAIDFDDSGFGYWVYDLAISLEHCRDDPAYPQFRDALLEGYAEYRSLPDGQLKHLELFITAWDVYLSLWATALAHLYPDYREEAFERLERSAGFVVRYVESLSSGSSPWPRR
jgi:Ser/Thr protein kinase RdoA (MazF antagonist)